MGVVEEHFGEECVDNNTEEKEKGRKEKDEWIEVKLCVVLNPRAHLDGHDQIGVLALVRLVWYVVAAHNFYLYSSYFR